MKIKQWIFALPVALFTLAACSNEGPGSLSGGDDVNTSGSSYLALSVANTAAVSTSADSWPGDYNADGETFNDGSEEEVAINPDPTAHRFIMFKGGQFFAALPLDIFDSDDNILVAQYSEADEENLPDQALLVLNWNNAEIEKLLAAKPALATVINAVQVYAGNLDAKTNAGYFPMTSSVYASADGTVNNAVALTGFQYYKSAEEAAAAPVKMYVERVAAKLTMRMVAGENDYYYFDETAPYLVQGNGQVTVRLNYMTDTDNGGAMASDYKVNIISWAPNTLEENVALFKNIGDGTGSGWTNYRLWNYEKGFRSFWGIDENYDNGWIYPDQYRPSVDGDITSAATLNSDGTMEPGTTPVTYISLSDVIGARARNIYSAPNTFDATILSEQDLNTYPYLRCGTHIIVAAQIIIKELDAKGVYSQNPRQAGMLDGVETVYYAEGYYWRKAPLLQQYFDGLHNSLVQGKAMPVDGKIYADNSGSVEMTRDNVEDYFDLAPAFVEGGDGSTYLAPKDGVSIYYTAPDGTITQLSAADFRDLIYEYTEKARTFTNGLMYYVLPVKQNIDSATLLDKNRVSTADYGVVRNHWYRLTVNSVNTIGTPVHDPEQPIIPNIDSEGETLAVQVEVIPWEEFDFGDIVL